MSPTEMLNSQTLTLKNLLILIYSRVILNVFLYINRLTLNLQLRLLTHVDAFVVIAIAWVAQLYRAKQTKNQEFPNLSLWHINKLFTFW